MKDRQYRIALMILSLIGLADSVYLTWIKLANQLALCGPIGDCKSVNSSEYAELYGIPIALLGAIAYAVMFLAVFLEPRVNIAAEYSPYLVFGMSLVGVLYSIYLTYIEVAVLYAICPYCVVSAVVLVIMLGLSLLRLFRNSDEAFA